MDRKSRAPAVKKGPGSARPAPVAGILHGPLPGPLFAPPGKALLLDLDRALAGTARLFPVPSGRRADLPVAVRELSRLLTEERGLLSRPYWASARFAAAYLHYFLPWNLYRLAFLLPGLDLPLAPGARVLDIGSGPLTLPLALWLARPDLRGLELEITCSDVSPAIMERGKSLFEHLAGPQSPWSIRLERGSVDHILARHHGRGFAAVLAGNTLNEICARPGGRDKTAPLAARLAGLMAAMRACLAPGGRLLLLEPGTRLGGKLIAWARQGALSRGLTALAPCTHAAPCPLAGHTHGFSPEAEYGPGADSDSAPARDPNRTPGRSTGWCHFILPAKDAPQALQGISAKAGLEKDTLSLSFALLAASGSGNDHGRATALRDDADLDDLESLYLEIMAGDERQADERHSPEAKAAQAAAGFEDREATAAPARPGPDGNWQGLCRVVSQPIKLTGRAEPGRYVCCELGLGLLLGGPDQTFGAALYAHRLDGDGRDAKSGALLLRPGALPVRAGADKAGAGQQKTRPRSGGDATVQEKGRPRTGGAKTQNRDAPRTDGAARRPAGKAPSGRNKAGGPKRQQGTKRPNATGGRGKGRNSA